MSTALNEILDPVAFTAERVVHWLVAPLFPEQVDDLMVPLMLGDVPVVLSVRGLVLPSTLEDGADLLVEGRTGQMNSRFTLHRQGSEWRTGGHHEDRPVDFKVNFGAEGVSVTGKTGHFHANCTIAVASDRLQVKGLLGGDHCDYEVTVGPTALGVHGLEHSENVHFDVTSGEKGWTWKGEMAKGYADLAFTGDGDKLSVSGSLYGHQCLFHVDRKEDGLYLEGFTGWGNLHFTVKPTEKGYAVKGRADDSLLDYHVTLSATTAC